MLLFDQNLSFKLCKILAGEFPGCEHVRDAGLSSADDADVWKHAAANGLMIVSKDQDFRQRAMLFGPPPKCIWIRLGNCSTADIASLLERRGYYPGVSKWRGTASYSRCADGYECIA